MKYIIIAQWREPNQKIGDIMLYMNDRYRFNYWRNKDEWRERRDPLDLLRVNKERIKFKLHIIF